MLERTLVFVDTSYLLASFYNSWETGARGQLEIDLREVVSVLDQMITQQLGQPVQRQMWYDGIPESGPHRYQRSLRAIDGVQLRAGQLIEWGDRRTQKAVDTRLVADMVIAGLRSQASDIVLVSGDADMLPGVLEASNSGVRVHLYGFGWDSMSGALRHACDSTTILDPREDFADSMQLNVLEGPIPPVVRNKPLGDAEPIEDLGATAVPDTRRTPPGSENNENADRSESENSTASTSRDVSKETIDGEPGAIVDNSTRESRDDEEDHAAATPTAMAETPRVREAEQAARMGAREMNAAAAERASIECAELQGKNLASAQRSAVTQPELNRDAAPSPAFLAEGRFGKNTGVKAQEARPEATSDVQPASNADNSNVDGANEAPSRPNPSMMAPRRKLRSRYVPLPNEVWASAGFQTPFDVGQQYANWWYEQIASEKARDEAHLLSGGGLPADIDRPLLQFACETLHEYTLTEAQRVSLRDGFHAGIRGVLLARKNQQAEQQ